MTECTGRSYWLRRINEARARYQAWAAKRAPDGAPYDQWHRWNEWRQARLAYFDDKIHDCRTDMLFKQRRKKHERKRDHTSLTRRGQ